MSVKWTLVVNSSYTRFKTLKLTQINQNKDLSSSNYREITIFIFYSASNTILLESVWSGFALIMECYNML